MPDETLYFRKPLIVHTYPVYLADIKSGVWAVEFNYDIHRRCCMLSTA
jgi:hypothetical protein